MPRASRRTPAAPSGAGAFADAVPAGLFSAAADGRLVFCNAVLKDWIGVSGEADELKLTDFLSGEDARQVLQRRKGATRTEAVIRSRGGVESPAVIVTVCFMLLYLTGADLMIRFVMTSLLSKGSGAG